MTVAKSVSENESNILAEVFVSRVQGNSPKMLSVSPRVMVTLLNQGVRGDVLRHVVAHIPKALVVRAAGTDVSNFSKLYRRQRLSGLVTEELNDLTKLWADLREFFDWDEELVKEWISQQLPALDGATPSELMSSQAGREIIKQQLDAMRFGDFA